MNGRPAGSHVVMQPHVQARMHHDTHAQSLTHTDACTHVCTHIHRQVGRPAGMADVADMPCVPGVEGKRCKQVLQTSIVDERYRQAWETRIR